MTAFKRAFELLRIADEDQIVRGLSGGDDIGERHLSGFIDEERIDRLEVFFARPHPRGSSHNVRGSL